MTKENELAAGFNTETFAFNFVGCIISHNPRLFETLYQQMLDYEEALLVSEFMNDQQERQAFLINKDILRELSLSTKNKTDDELALEFQKLLSLLRKKEGEVTNV